MSQGRFFEHLFEQVAERGREFLAQAVGGLQGDVDLLPGLSTQLLAQRGEATAAALAQKLVDAFADLDGDGRQRYFDYLASELNPDPDSVLAAAKRYQTDPSPEATAQLGRVCEPPRQELFRRINMASGGTAMLVALRSALLDRIDDHPKRRVVDDDLLHLFGSWFNRGFLTLQQIDWRTPAFLLEKLIAYESVHAIQGWDDLRRRLERDRRCFAFFHPALVDEPLIFVEVALVNGMAASIQPLLDQDQERIDPNKADCAIFYSINNCQKGLRGVSFGNFLIKQVAAELQEELPNLKTFATLSPVPGFRRWLSSDAAKTAAAAPSDEGVVGEIVSSLDDPDWYQSKERSEALREATMGLAAHYLLKAKRSDERPLDPVARFHLGNGARLERVNWMGDPSPNGIRQSGGIMVNYLYNLDELERNHEAYVNRKHVIAARRVEQLAKGGASLINGSTS
ncbi:MAG: malonyl-CoA decarboxylase [Geminicoccaceae bacterium]